MKTVDVRQRSPEWHRWRAGGISATSAAVIVNQNPDKTPWRLWAETLGIVERPDISMIPQVQIAVMLEPHALAWFEDHYGMTPLSCCGESDEEPVIRASFDGLLEDQDVVEVKILSDSNFEEVKRLGEESSHYKLYWWQVQHQLYVSGGAKGYLLFYHTRQVPIVIEILRDDAAIADLVVKELAFWELVKAKDPKKAPAKCPQRDYFTPEGECLREWVVFASDIRHIEAELAAMETRRADLIAKREALQGRLIGLMGDNMLAEAEGVRVNRYVQAGLVGWKKVAQSLDPDFDESKYDKFRSEPSNRVRITVDDAPMSVATMQHLWGGGDVQEEEGSINFYY